MALLIPDESRLVLLSVKKFWKIKTEQATIRDQYRHLQLIQPHSLVLSCTTMMAWSELTVYLIFNHEIDSVRQRLAELRLEPMPATQWNHKQAHPGTAALLTWKLVCSTSPRVTADQLIWICSNSHYAKKHCRTMETVCNRRGRLSIGPPQKTGCVSAENWFCLSSNNLAYPRALASASYRGPMLQLHLLLSSIIP